MHRTTTATGLSPIKRIDQETVCWLIPTSIFYWRQGEGEVELTDIISDYAGLRPIPRLFRGLSPLESPHGLGAHFKYGNISLGNETRTLTHLLFGSFTCTDSY